MEQRSPSLIAHFFSGGFRPFFLAGALHAALMIALWVPWFLGFIHVPTALSPVGWIAMSQRGPCAAPQRPTSANGIATTPLADAPADTRVILVSGACPQDEAAWDALAERVRGGATAVFGGDETRRSVGAEDGGRSAGVHLGRGEDHRIPGSRGLEDGLEQPLVVRLLTRRRGLGELHVVGDDARSVADQLVDDR